MVLVSKSGIVSIENVIIDKIINIWIVILNPNYAIEFQLIIKTYKIVLIYLW